MIKDAQIVSQFKKHMRATQRGLSKQFQNSRTSQSFYAGDMMDYRDQVQFVSQTGQKKRALVQFNKVKPYVNAVKGFMAQNRRKPRYEAMIRGQTIQELYSQYANALSDFCREKMHADQVETQQDGDMLICGYGAVETALTYGQGHSTRDPNGEIIMGRLDPLAVGWDPFAKQTNLLDARWVYYERDYALHDALELFSDSEEQDFDDAVDLDHDDEGGYTWYARGGRYNKIKEGNVDWSDERANMVKVYFYQWVEYETYYRAENPVKGLKNPVAQQWAQMQLDALAQEFNDGEDDDQFQFNPRDEILSFDGELKNKLEAHFGDFIECFPFKRKVFYTAVLSKNHIFSKYRSICQSGFSVKFKTGDYDSKNKIWTGMVNSMKEPVMYYNKALTELMFTIGVNTKGGWFVEKDAVEDVSDFEQKVAKTDSVIVVETGALSGAGGPKIKAKREGYAPTGYENILTLTDKSIVDANGIDKAFLGSSENKQETGILFKRRIKQVVSALACYFDSITLYQIEEARLLLDFLRVYAENNAGGLFHIIGPDGRRQFLQISADKLAPDYDVTPGEAPESQEEKFEHAEIITGVADKILQINPRGAMMLYSIAIKYMPLDGADLQQILKVLVPQNGNVDPAYVQKLEQQVQQLTSQATQVQMQKVLAEIAKTHAQAVDIGAQTEMRGASQTKVEQEALRTALENSMLRSEPAVEPQVRVSI